MQDDSTPATDDHEDEPVVQYRGADLDPGAAATSGGETPSEDFDPVVQYRGTEVDADSVEAVEEENPREGEADPDGVVQYRGATAEDE